MHYRLIGMRCESATQTTNHDTKFVCKQTNFRTHLDIFLAALATPSSSALCSSSLIVSRQDDGDQSGRRLAVEEDSADSADRIVLVAHLVPVFEGKISGRTKADAKRDGCDGEDDAAAKARMAAAGADTSMVVVGTLALDFMLLSPLGRK